ncbi:MAG: hypothetical protein HKN89_01845, partial [Eudoraea sp.]|nr:hypothetical protein [Eudoraea sp.]
ASLTAYKNPFLRVRPEASGTFVFTFCTKSNSPYSLHPEFKESHRKESSSKRDGEN